ncbi:DUF3934 family protein [Paenibacillus sp.]|uniref:DUF3934 family protein n=1 Tax=Paenibacillus sp. TaxID=58172 RepID=UPI0034640E02
MSKAKGKGGTGRGTDKKGWNRWQAKVLKKRITQSRMAQRATAIIKDKGVKSEI